MTQLSLNISVAEPQIIKKELLSLTGGFQLQYSHSHGQLYQGDSIDWLTSLDSESVNLIFAGPPYNIKKADWDNFENQEKYIEWSIKWISHIAIFLNHVQRKKTKQLNRYGINTTFLSGHFKAYTIKRIKLDGVYYCDIRPNYDYR